MKLVDIQVCKNVRDEVKVFVWSHSSSVEFFKVDEYVYMLVAFIVEMQVRDNIANKINLTGTQ